MKRKPVLSNVFIPTTMESESNGGGLNSAENNRHLNMTSVNFFRNWENQSNGFKLSTKSQKKPVMSEANY